jgi:hypothetical protein
LKEAADAAQISPSTQVRLNTDGAWVAAGSVPGLFDTPPLPLTAEIAEADHDQAGLDEAWRVVKTTAIATIFIALFVLVGQLLSVASLVTGIEIADELPPLEEQLTGLLFSVPFYFLALAGAFAALRRRQWGVAVLAITTLLGCWIVMVFIVGDAFSRVWKSFSARR